MGQKPEDAEVLGMAEGAHTAGLGEGTGTVRGAWQSPVISVFTVVAAALVSLSR